MTNLQEAKLAREAEISYATLAMVTDYDCWREGHDDVTVDQVIAVMHQNSGNAQKVVKAAVRLMPTDLERQPRPDRRQVRHHDRQAPPSPPPPKRS